LPELETKLKAFKTTSQPKAIALETLGRLKAEVGMKNIRSDKKEVKEILKKDWITS
jgi:hypothetical protein